MFLFKKSFLLFLLSNIILIVYINSEILDKSFINQDFNIKEKESLNEVKEFLNNFYKTITENFLEINENCIGEKNTEFLKSIKREISNKEFFNIFKEVFNFLENLKENCPFDKLQKLLMDLENSLKTNDFQKNLMNNFLTILSKYEEYINSKKSYEDLGKLIGRLFKLAVYGKGINII